MSKQTELAQVADTITVNSGNVGIGTSSPNTLVHLSGTSEVIRIEDTDATLAANQTIGKLEFYSNDASGAGVGVKASVKALAEDSIGRTSLVFSTADSSSNDTEAMRIDSSGNVGIGTSSPQRVLVLSKSDSTGVQTQYTNSTTGVGASDGFTVGIDGSENAEFWNFQNTDMLFATNGSERMRLDASGNLLVGKTSADNTTAGTTIYNTLGFSSVRSGNVVGILNRLSNDGDILQFRKDGSTVGSIGIQTGALIIDGQSGYTGVYYGTSGWLPRKSGALTDNSVDVGAASYRFDDIYATNATIQTSDANEKQQIASLIDAEITAAKAISKLFKTFKWNSSVAENGDNARTHTGVVAQQIETAMTDAGLNAGNYAFFVSSTWEDEDGNSQTRKGIRYPELLSFIGAATEQRLASIESRLDALEAE